MNIKKDIIWRIYLAFLAVCGLGVGIMVKGVALQTNQGDQWRAMADSLHIQYRSIDAVRGNVLSEDGRLLATSLPYYNIRIDFASEAMTDEVFKDNVDSLALCMAQYFGDKSKNGYLQELKQARRAGKRYYLVMMNATFPQLQTVKSWPLLREGKYRGGLIVEQENKRVMPFRMLAHRTIGYVGREGAMDVGLESSYNDYLAGTRGKRLMQRISGGTWIPVNDEDEIVAINGKDIVTTIDINLQDVAENALLKALKKHKADHGSVVVMEVATGKIKAIANLGLEGEEDYFERYNYAVGEASEPGSTFKLASMIALLEDGYIDINDSVDLEKGRVEFFDKTMRDSDDHDYRNVTVKRAFEISSNVGVSKLVNQYYAHQPEKFMKHIEAMRLHELTGIEIAGEGKPLFKAVSGWSGTTLPWMSVGYELTMTPLQMLTFYNAVANDGKMMKPYLVSAVSENGKPVKTIKPTVLERSICSDATLDKVQEMLTGVAENGTADHLNRKKRYTFAGKTGTAQIVENGRYTRDYQASFAGYFPAEEPKYSCIVVVNAPKSGVYYGGWVAGPVFEEIANKVYATELDLHQPVNHDSISYLAKLPKGKSGYKPETQKVYASLGITGNDNTTSSWINCQVSDSAVAFTEKPLIENLVPYVEGMGLRDAIYLCEQAGLKVVTTGRGRVYSQSIRSGVRANGQTIELRLR